MLDEVAVSGHFGKHCSVLFCPVLFCSVPTSSASFTWAYILLMFVVVRLFDVADVCGSQAL